MHIYKIPGFVRWILPGVVWRIRNSTKQIFLTFDDGPVPGVTDWVLDTLKENKAKATFFVVGDNVRRYPKLYDRILKEGHSVGNHTFNHINAWKYGSHEYLENVLKCEQQLNRGNGKFLFRPPHGKLTLRLIKELKKKYAIIMWDVLSGDFNPSISSRRCLIKTLKNTSDGTIVVFHDSYKSEKKLKAVLPLYMRELVNRGYAFSSL